MASAPPAAGPPGGINAVAPLTPNAWLRYDLVERMLPAGVTDVLEIGCGQGSLGARLAQRYHYLGVEPDRASWELAQQRIRAADHGEVRNITSDELGTERFDLVCAFEVLEHIEDDAAAVKQWAARLRPRGWHFRRYDPAAMAALLDRCGFGEIEIRQYGFPLGYLLEAARNAIGRRRLAAAADTSAAERTAGSGRFLQPSGRARGAATQWGTAPFRLLQRAFPHTGPGLVVRARVVG